MYVSVPGCLLGTIDCRNSSRVFLEFLPWCWFFVSVTLTEAATRFKARPPANSLRHAGKVVIIEERVRILYRLPAMDTQVGNGEFARRNSASSQICEKCRRDCTRYGGTV